MTAENSNEGEEITGSGRRYPIRRWQKTAPRFMKADDSVPLSAHLMDSQDSGFETGSDLSVTPILQVVSTAITDQSQSIGFPDKQVANSNRGTMKHPSVRKSKATGKKSSTPLSHKGEGKERLLICSVKCGICDAEDEKNLVICNGHCFQGFHLDCLGIVRPPTTGFYCDECLTTPTVCFQCKKSESPLGDALLPCTHSECDKHYHLSCVRLAKTFVINEKKFECGLHSCAKCTGTKTTLTTTAMLQCIRCPVALHKTTCLVAGCEILSDREMICYTHIDLKSVSLPQSIGHFNMNTCLDCGEAGSLVCCDFCSAAYHNHCLSEEHRASDSAQEWVCPCCASHDLPTYESAVMCKCGPHR